MIRTITGEMGSGVAALEVFYWGSFLVLVLTKAADFVSTIRDVPPEAEANPWAGDFSDGLDSKVVCGSIP